MINSTPQTTYDLRHSRCTYERKILALREKIDIQIGPGKNKPKKSCTNTQEEGLRNLHYKIQTKLNFINGGKKNFMYKSWIMKEIFCTEIVVKHKDPRECLVLYRLVSANKSPISRDGETSFFVHEEHFLERKSCTEIKLDYKGESLPEEEFLAIHKKNLSFLEENEEILEQIVRCRKKLSEQTEKSYDAKYKA